MSDETQPGALEIDLVEHNGGNSSGHYAYTWSVVDMVTGWSRRQAVLSKSRAVIHEALTTLLADWPTRICGMHSDNGGEFLNAHLIDFCKAKKIDYHRSRAYKMTTPMSNGRTGNWSGRWWAMSATMLLRR